MTKYLKSEPFSSRPMTKEYAEGWDRIFGKKKDCPHCGGSGACPDCPEEMGDACLECNGSGKVPDVDNGSG